MLKVIEKIRLGCRRHRRLPPERLTPPAVQLRYGDVVEDVRTVFEQQNDTTVYIPDLRTMELV